MIITLNGLIWLVMRKFGFVCVASGFNIPLTWFSSPQQQFQMSQIRQTVGKMQNSLHQNNNYLSGKNDVVDNKKRKGFNLGFIKKAHLFQCIKIDPKFKIGTRSLYPNFMTLRHQQSKWRGISSLRISTYLYQISQRGSGAIESSIPLPMTSILCQASAFHYDQIWKILKTLWLRVIIMTRMWDRWLSARLQ